VAAWGMCIAAFGLILVAAPGASPGDPPHPLIWPAALVLGLAGCFDTVSAIFRSTILQVATPDSYRGRLQGVFTVVVAGGPHLGALFLGTTSSFVGERWAAVVGGVLCAVAMVVTALWQKGLFAYDSRHPESVEPATA
jgi:MFS family permease